MPWMIVGATGLATAGLLVLGWLGLRVWLDVRSLAREVDTASRALARSATRLEAAAAPLADALAATATGAGRAPSPDRAPPR
ncbi:hypothetical protein [Peterkaempfera bronchialis]|uniref:Uncharacterized protein n=1 Tax=Peterkaempfera bronchialis TaxID=2126346 RepID=A0A345T3S1_9ACTN|nr:hypothetical protein [Peterkaempfera bronchialis]AXI80626.1 hypothetical protein C7M71_027805 [Peterkaempfera bronchialis]